MIVLYCTTAYEIIQDDARPHCIITLGCQQSSHFFVTACLQGAMVEERPNRLGREVVVSEDLTVLEEWSLLEVGAI